MPQWTQAYRSIVDISHETPTPHKAVGRLVPYNIRLEVRGVNIPQHAVIFY